MPELMLTGFILTVDGPEEFAVYRHLNHRPEASSHFSCVDHKFTKHGWATLNASGGLPAYAREHMEYFESSDDCFPGSTAGKPFPVDPLSHATDLADFARLSAG